MSFNDLHKKVICTITNVIYESIAEAERMTGAKNVVSVCQGVRNTALGLHFKYCK